jgi:hypothetical protein
MTRSVSAWRLVETVLAVGALALLAWLWPAPLGGSARVLVVQGSSMVPTFHHGDVVIARAGAPDVGEVGVYRIPTGEVGEGALVIHRVIGVAGDGTLVLQGDSHLNPDPWNADEHDFVGTPVLAVPFVGTLLAAMFSWLGAAAAAGCVVAWVIAVPDLPRPESDRSVAPSTGGSDRRAGFAPTVVCTRDQ